MKRHTLIAVLVLTLGSGFIGAAVPQESHDESISKIERIALPFQKTFFT